MKILQEAKINIYKTPSNAGEIKENLAKYGLYAKKAYGQNFLADKALLDKIVMAIEPSASDFIVEIGPGLGVLTERLLQKAGFVAAVEIDKDMIIPLSENLKSYSNAKIINRDFLKFDYNSFVNSFLEKNNKNLKVVGNLPYYITTPLIFKILESPCQADSLVFMAQKEVADRIAAKPGRKDYGLLTLTVGYYSTVEFISKASPSSFFPQPGVDSAVLKLKRWEKPPVKTRKELFFKVVKAAFSTRRKTLLNCLASAETLNLDKPQAATVLKSAGIPENIRGECLSIADFDSICLSIDNLFEIR